MKKLAFSLLTIIFGLFFASQAIVAVGGISINKTLSVSESSNASKSTKDFQIKLTPSPTQTVTLSYFTNGQCTLSHEATGFTSGGSIVSNGDTFNMRVRAVDDEVAEGNHFCRVALEANSLDPNYDGATKEFTVAIQDNGDQIFTPLFSIEKISGDNVEEGSSKVVEYRLITNRPLDDQAVITAHAGENCEMLVGEPEVRSDTSERVIKAGQSSSPAFRIIAREDNVFEGFHSCIITHTSTTADMAFNTISPPPYIVSVKDNDETDLQRQNREREEAEQNAEASARGIVNAVDANNDGIADTKQPHVQSFVNTVSGTRQALVIDGCDIRGSVLSKSQHEVTADESIHYPYGLLEFSLLCKKLGQSARVTWILDQSYPLSYPWILRKIDNMQSELIMNAQFSEYELQKGNVTSVTYDVVDGGFGDADQQVNGIIEDPVGLGIPLALLSADTDQDSQSTQGLAEAVKLSLILAVAILLVGALMWWKPIRTRIIKVIDGKPSDKPRIDKY